MKRLLLLVVGVLTLTGLLGSCGREAPVGTLAVTSDPDGMTFLISQAGSAVETPPAERITPFSQVMATGRYEIRPDVDPTRLRVEPASRSVEVGPARRVEAAFSMTRLGRVDVSSSPSGAAIQVDGEDSGEVTPATLYLPEGDRVLEGVAADLLQQGGPLTVAVDPDTPADVTLTLLPAGTLLVTSVPDGAAVIVDDADTGLTTPAEFPAFAGERRVEVRRDGWIASPDVLQVTVPEGGSAAAAFTLAAEGSTGDLDVRSVPAGAAIRLDGVDTGEVTPHVFSLPPSEVQVAVSRAGFRDAAPVAVTPTPGGTVTEEFVLQARKIALVEMFSGVDCNGCPDMNAMLNVVENAGYGPEIMLGVKYSGPFGSATEQHFDVNMADLQARMTYFAQNTPWQWAAPTLFFDGVLSGFPGQNNGYPLSGDLVQMLDAAAAQDPGFVLDVHVTDWHAEPLEVVVDLVPTRDVDLSGYVLNLAVVENPVVYEVAQNDAGETEFHWICREFEQLAVDLGNIGADAPGRITAQVPKQATAWNQFVFDNLFAIAFVQDPVTLEVLQAGALVPAGHAHLGRKQP